MIIRISSAALSDHLSRLYGSQDNVHYQHIDNGGSIQVLKTTKTTATISLDEIAINEFIDDLEYQIEFCEYDIKYKGQCQRALKKLEEAK